MRFTKISLVLLAILSLMQTQGCKHENVIVLTDCDSTQFKFSTHIQPMIVRYCAGCHTYPNASGSVELSSHTGVAFVAKNGTLMNSLTHPTNWMPKGGNRLSVCQIKQFEKWIKAGAPND